MQVIKINFNLDMKKHIEHQNAYGDFDILYTLHWNYIREDIFEFSIMLIKSIKQVIFGSNKVIKLNVGMCHNRNRAFR